jgi:transposase
MVGTTRVEVQEDCQLLADLLHKEKNADFKERIQALYLLKKEKMSITAIAKVLGKDRSTIHRWMACYQKGGMNKLLNKGKGSGRKRVIPDWAIASLEKQLEEAEGKFHSYTQVQNWLSSKLGVKAKYATVHHWTRYQLQAKLKVPRPISKKQDLEKRMAFKKT